MNIVRNCERVEKLAPETERLLFCGYLTRKIYVFYALSGGNFSRGHIFNDANKRTALNTAILFLKRNGVSTFDAAELVELTVGATTGEVSFARAAEMLRKLYS